MKIRDNVTGQIIEVDEKDPANMDTTEVSQLFEAQPKLQKEEQHTNKLNEAKSASEVFFPRSSVAMKTPSGLMQKMGSITMDVLSGILTAPVAAGRSVDPNRPQSYLKSYEQISQGLGPTGEPNILSSIISDPSTVPSVMTGAGLANWAYKGGKWLKLGKNITSGAAEGAVSAGVRQADNVIKGEEASLGDAAKEVGLSTAVPATLGVGAKIVNKGLGVLASQLSNVSEETLRKWGTGFGKGAKELKEVHGKQHEIGKKILNALDNFEEFLPEKKVVDEALEKMPPVDLNKVVAALEGSKVKNPIGINKKVNTQIQSLIDDIQQTKKLPDSYVSYPSKVTQEGARTSPTTITTKGKEINPGTYTSSSTKGNSRTIPSKEIRPEIKSPSGGRNITGKTIKRKSVSATEFIKIRRQLDESVQSAFQKDYKKGLEKAVLNARNSMMNELKEVAGSSGNKEYIGAMESWSDKLQKRDALIEEIGSNAKTRNKRIGVFMSTLFNKNKETRQKALGDMSEIFGEDFVEQAKLLQMSDAMLQQGGKFSKIMPNRETGAGATALAPAMATGSMAKYFESPKTMAAALLLAAEASPMASSKVLTVADLAEWMAKQPAQLGARQKATED